MLLHTVRFLCSVAAAFARLLRELRKAIAMAISVRHRALQSPPIGLIAAAPLALRRNKQQAAPVATVHMQEQVLLAPPQPVLVVPAPRDVVVVGDSGVEERQAENHSNKQKKVACAMMRRPSRLVIPVADDADEVAAGWGAAAAASENADVEVEGEGFCLASKAGPRHAMEDGYAVITDKNGGDSELAFYGVYDGHGGRAAVDFVSEHLGRNVVSAVLAASTEEASAKEDAVSAAIRAAYLKTDSELLAQQQGASGGACAATAVVTGGKLYVAHLGDCRAVLGRVAGGGGGATAVALTADHTCASEGERARVERDGGYVSRSGSGVWRVQGSLAVSRAFGDAALKRWVLADPAVAAVPISSAGAGEFLVVASDGLWDKVGNQEAVDAVRRGGASRAAACRELVDLARRRGSRDDVTVMVVDLQRFAR